MSFDPLPREDDLLEQVRRKLQAPQPAERHWAALAAAAFFALCAIVFAAAAVLAPPNSESPAAKSGVK
jgi:hypothetical protein